MTIHTPIEARSGRVPAWAAIVTVFLLLVGGFYVASNLAGENPALAVPGPSGSGSPNASGRVDSGAALAIIKTAGCQACHGQDFSGGLGPDLHGIAKGPATPDLKKLTTDHPNDWIQLWIAGTDPAVKNIDRKGMPVFGGQLSPAQINIIAEYLKTL
ncbi:MAG: c-type cytochrome [Chloroflexota bacterium]|nr:c-type cytochrome [Chloroflexota bacterium]